MGRLEKVSSFDGDTVGLSFRDGTEAIGSIAISYDRSHSQVREFLVGYEAAQLEPVGLTMINYPRGGYIAEEAQLMQTLHPVFEITSHPRGPRNLVMAC